MAREVYGTETGLSVTTSAVAASAATTSATVDGSANGWFSYDVRISIIGATAACSGYARFYNLRSIDGTLFSSTLNPEAFTAVKLSGTSTVECVRRLQNPGSIFQLYCFNDSRGDFANLSMSYRGVKTGA